MKNLDFLLDNFISHRGMHNESIPENSIPAFKKAVNSGYTIELDVHLTKDNKIVVFHDHNLKRMCSVNKRIENCTYEELLKYNLLDTKYKIPLFKEVLSLVDNKVGLLIELKVDEFDSKLEQELCKILDNYSGRYAVQSFNIKTIKWFKKNRPNYIRGLLSSDFEYKKTSNLVKWVGKTLISDIILKTDFISYDKRALPSKYVENKRKTKPILVWTIKSNDDYVKCKNYADNFICENINTLKK